MVENIERLPCNTRLDEARVFVGTIDLRLRLDLRLSILRLYRLRAGKPPAFRLAENSERLRLRAA
jgi:hypothetical protein